jgi:hypothetical protein
MLIYDVGKNGCSTLSIYVTRDDKEAIKILLRRLGYPSLQYYDRQGRGFAMEWWVEKVKQKSAKRKLRKIGLAKWLKKK